MDGLLVVRLSVGWASRCVALAARPRRRWETKYITEFVCKQCVRMFAEYRVGDQRVHWAGGVSLAVHREA